MSKKGGYYCAFKNCRGLSRRDKRSFFRFPKDPQRSKQWVVACDRNDLLEKTPIELFNSYRVCAKHFTDTMFLNDLRNRLQPNSVPMQLDPPDDSDDSLDVDKKKDETANSQDPVENILKKISADEFFKATGIRINEPVSAIKATQEYLQNSSPSDHVYSSTRDNDFINIDGSTLAIDIDDNEQLNSVEAFNYQDLINSLPFNNTSNTDSSSLETDKDVRVERIPQTILDGQDIITSPSPLNSMSDTFETLAVMTQTDNIYQDATQTELFLVDEKLDKTSQTESIIIDQLEESTQTSTSFFDDNKAVDTKLEQSSQTESCLLKDKTSKKKFKKLLENKKNEILELKDKVQQNFVSMMDNITLEQYELLTEKFFPKETSDFIKIQAQLFKKKNNNRKYSLEFKKQCLSLFLTGPRTYKNLQKIFCLPALTLRLNVKTGHSQTSKMNAESKINIHHSSLVGLKAELLRKKAEVEAAKAKFENVGPVNRSKPKERKTQEKQNKKQTEKDGKDNLSEEVEDVKALKKSKLMLQAKSRLYEKLAKSHNNMNPNFLVDFEHKPDSSDHSEEENSKNNGVNENESDYDSDDGWVEYTDCFGRTRKCLREDLPKMQEKDDYLMKTVVEKEQHKEKKEKPLFFEDRVPEKEPEIEMMRRKWEEETAKLANKVDIHYQDVLFDEARTHGVGYYAFSQDEEERAKQQENLMKLRKETEQKQKENQEIRDMKERMQQNRLRVARLRQRIRAGLPAEESEEETVEASSTDPLRVKTEEKEENEEKEKTESDTNQSKSSSDEKQASTKRKHEDVENKIEAFGKVLGKSNEWYVMSQEEWTMKKRKERIQEFAPVYNNFQRGESFDLKNCDANKNQDLPKSNQDESSSDSDIIGPLPPPNYAPDLKEQIPLPPANDVSQISEDSTDHASVNIADQIAAGLKYLRKQFESKHHQ
ncbi:hypothetical protein TSAR_000735 [Trichomalopsis sarcophagae]|uniref:THAP-type domain-containing protein n=1 Tax=Trichomalopsis sarcophagae TaxID=543379 RepID=A0A232EV56_9HYME|nr:hypothetical protein TSAR_000735 [Trichomalopsis sarcophagae]